MRATAKLQVSFRKAPFPGGGFRMPRAPRLVGPQEEPAMPADSQAPSSIFTPPAATWSIEASTDVNGKPRCVWPLFGLESIPPVTDEQRSLASSLFGKGSRYLGNQETMLKRDAPTPGWQEIVVIGRSNVGKSSLLNALLGSKDHSFVPVSKHPGKTHSLDWYGVGTALQPHLVLVDTPGYGYSRGSKQKHEEWMNDISRYLRHRERSVLARVTMLVDARLGLGEADSTILAQLEETHTPVHVVATKADTVSQGVLEALALSVATELNKHMMPYPVLNAVSSRTGAGMRELRETMVQTSKVHRKVKGMGYVST